MGQQFLSMYNYSITRGKRNRLLSAIR